MSYKDEKHTDTNKPTSADNTRRKLLKTGAWASPVILSVGLPAHAQMTDAMDGGDMTGGDDPITVSLACTDVESFTTTNAQALGDIDITVNATITATLLTGDAGSDLSGIPVTVTLSSSILRDGSSLLVEADDVVVNGVTDGNGEFVLGSEINYAASDFFNPGPSFAVDLIVSVSSDDPRVTSVGMNCSCSKSKTDTSSSLTCM